jgi:heat shock protein HslJ
MKLNRILAAIVIAISASACGATPGGANVDQITGVAWAATEISGKPVNTRAPVTLSFADGRASGRSGCNRYSGTATIEAGRIRIAEIVSTKMACMEDGAMQTEMTYLQALSGAEAWSVSADGMLTLTGSKGTVVFRALQDRNGL